MKFLCLHGAYGSAENFQVQLGPFVSEVQDKSGIAFKWINGAHTAQPPAGFENYFGAPPLYRHVEFDGIGALDDILTKIREFPEGLSPEDTMRKLSEGGGIYPPNALRNAMDRILPILEADPEIEGIIGYSEGATMAATLILEEQRRFEEEGTPRRLKCAAFFAGWPPVKIVDGKVETMLADVTDDMLDIPTFHIVGCNDPYIQGAMALFNTCDEDHAILFDHGKGHTVPRDQRTIKELATAFEQFVAKGKSFTF
ncbi:serine hydrolase FSH [Xylariales sp. PMI_506]|nr:serine hydrolase FSH [Xylariales sp. PMI_506]